MRRSTKRSINQRSVMPCSNSMRLSEMNLSNCLVLCSDGSTVDRQPVLVLLTACIALLVDCVRSSNRMIVRGLLIPEAEAVAMPVQGLDLVAPAIDEHVERG